MSNLFFFQFIKNHKLNCIAFLLFILSYYLYYLSLEKCFEGFDVCAIKADWIFIKLFEVGLSYVIISILMEGIILKLISKYHLFHLIFMYLLY